MTSHHPMNVERAEWARNALEVFSRETYGGQSVAQLQHDPEDKDGGSDYETCIQDLITDLLHLAGQNGINTERMHQHALGMYREELAQPEI